MIAQATGSKSERARFSEASDSGAVARAVG
jgi:hypothetical protein